LPNNPLRRRPEAVAPPNPHQTPARCAVELGWRPPHEVSDAPEQSVPLSLDHHARCRLFTPVTYERAPNPSCIGVNLSPLPSPTLFCCAPRIALIHAGELDIDSVMLRVPPQHVERIEPHRLVVEERAV